MKWQAIALVLIAATLQGVEPAVPASNGASDLSYEYRDTRRLVDLVDSAADLVQQKGKGAFREFEVEGSRWLYGQ